jgi:hypothetical protein
MFHEEMMQDRDKGGAWRATSWPTLKRGHAIT